MCGLTGFLQNGIHKSTALNVLESMLKPLHHRGPDDGGVWYDENAGIGLAHRRLSIVDLSPAGHQPMTSHSDRYVFVFNGEIYNHLDLRTELNASGHNINWRGHSDTETLLAGFDAWGIELTIKKTIGMFAFALWDKNTRQLTLGRDRLGEKPLYYGWQGQGENAVFLFGSELKALRAHPSFQNIINRDAIALQLKYNHIPAPYSIYNDIFKVNAGCLVNISFTSRTINELPYWSASQELINGKKNTYTGSSIEAVNKLEELLKNTILQQMTADVPLGALLSGGIDSSLIVALMQKQSNKAIKTFTIGFDNQIYNEATYAKKIANHLGTDHSELYISAQQALDVIPKLPTVFDEPFSDSSQIPTFLVSQLASNHVTVTLTGDGGDELFCGYNRHLITNNYYTKLANCPHYLRIFIANLIRLVPPKNWDNLYKLTNQFQTGTGYKIHKGADALESRSINDLHEHFVTHWPRESVVISESTSESFNTNKINLNTLSPAEQMMALDLLNYLPNDILTKLDRSSMACSLETRIPLLDHRIVEFASKLPIHLKLKNNESKWILREILYRHIPKVLFDRPKMGFSIPLDEWLRGLLRDWSENLLDETRLTNEGFLNPTLIRKKWLEHLSGQGNWGAYLWDVLMFQAWIDEQ